MNFEEFQEAMSKKICEIVRVNLEHLDPKMVHETVGMENLHSLVIDCISFGMELSKSEKPLEFLQNSERVADIFREHIGHVNPIVLNERLGEENLKKIAFNATVFGYKMHQVATKPGNKNNVDPEN